MISGSIPSQGLLNTIRVVPNPYIASSNYNENEYKRKIYFYDLPEDWELQIFTITGEKVISLEPDGSDPGKASWDLRTVNNQEVAPGLYVFVVENRVLGYEGQKFIGKFAIVR